MNRIETTIFPAELTVVAWTDTAAHTQGFPTHHPYFEVVWLPIVGPSAAWILRRLVAQALHAPDGAIVHLGDLARAVGLGPAIATNSTVQPCRRRRRQRPCRRPQQPRHRRS
jgi:hypothetical protein